MLIASLLHRGMTMPAALPSARQIRAENSHPPFRRRERAMQRFRRMKSLQKFASLHASLHNHFSQERHLVDRQMW